MVLSMCICIDMVLKKKHLDAFHWLRAESRTSWFFTSQVSTTLFALHFCWAGGPPSLNALRAKLRIQGNYSAHHA